MRIMDKAKRVGAAIGIASTIHGTVLPKTIDTNLSKQYGDYSKEVRLPATRREVERQLRQATRNKGAAVGTSSKQLGKEAKKLK